MAQVTAKTTNRFNFRNTQGARLPGWEDVNCAKLATQLGKSDKHLRGVLAGRFGTTLKLIEEIAGALGISAAHVVEKITLARGADEKRFNEAKVRLAERRSRRRDRTKEMARARQGRSTL